jgi:hypothetical protein
MIQVRLKRERREALSSPSMRGPGAQVATVAPAQAARKNPEALRRHRFGFWE